MEGESTVMRVSATQRAVTLVLSLPSLARVFPGRAICNLLSVRKCFLSRLSLVSYYASLRIRIEMIASTAIIIRLPRVVQTGGKI